MPLILRVYHTCGCIRNSTWIGGVCRASRRMKAATMKCGSFVSSTIDVLLWGNACEKDGFFSVRTPMAAIDALSCTVEAAMAIAARFDSPQEVVSP
jgi:hypothetical protein